MDANWNTVWSRITEDINDICSLSCYLHVLSGWHGTGNESEIKVKHKVQWFFAVFVNSFPMCQEKIKPKTSLFWQNPNAGPCICGGWNSNSCSILVHSQKIHNSKGTRKVNSVLNRTKRHFFGQKWKPAQFWRMYGCGVFLWSLCAFVLCEQGTKVILKPSPWFHRYNKGLRSCWGCLPLTPPSTY